LAVAHHIECDAYGIPDNPFGYEELFCLGSHARALFSSSVKYKWPEFNDQVSLPSKFHELTILKPRFMNQKGGVAWQSPSQLLGLEALQRESHVEKKLSHVLRDGR
jgi:hypothetical protein